MKAASMALLFCGAALAQGEFGEFVARAKSSVTRDLKDPASAQFRATFISRVAGKPYLCGEINAKNSYGAYVGFRKFYASEAIKAIDGPEWPELVPATWPSLCGSRVADVD